MINTTNLIVRGNPSAVEIAKPGRMLAGFARAAAAAVEWLTGIPHWIGIAIFAAGDAEARWRGWRSSERQGGLARSYRDLRFDTWTTTGGTG